MSELRWATPTRHDDPAWVGLLAAMEAADHRGETYELEDLDDEWTSVWSHPETDAVFVWEGDRLLGFAWLKAMPGQREAHRVACWGGVHPSHRRRGIGTELFTWMLKRAGEIATAFDAALPTTAQIDAADHQADLRSVAERAGFESARRFLEIARVVSAPVAPVVAPAGVRLVPWSEDLDEAARHAQVDAFTDHWGSEPRTREEWRQWYTGHRSFRPDLSVLAVAEGTGDVVSLVLSAAYPQDWTVQPVEAWINTVGTRRAWRGQGLARWLLSDVHKRIAASDTGFERAILGVDADNPTGAIGLYRSLGYADVRGVTTFSHRLSGG